MGEIKRIGVKPGRKLISGKDPVFLMIEISYA